MDQDELLHTQIAGFDGLSDIDFADLYEDRVGDLDTEVVQREYTAPLVNYGRCRVHVFVGGLVHVRNRGGKNWLFETEARVEAREHIAAWADFARGHWTDTAPTTPGTYPTRRRDGVRGPDHTFQLIGGNVRDTVGYVPSGRATQWLGDFWSVAYPSLPGAV